MIGLIIIYLSDAPTFTPSLLNISFIFDLLLQKFFNNILKSDNADFFKNRIGQSFGILSDLCDDSHLKLSPLEEPQNRLKLSLMIDGDDFPHEYTGELL